MQTEIEEMLPPKLTKNQRLSYPKLRLLNVFLVVQRFTLFICATVYYKLFWILIFLNGIFLYFSRS